ncbi:insulinase family protein [Candidatus Fermentibacteria bacterium]|nr:insulinase family protein [Candidatus Fermentibacteria bacterium]
MRTVLPLFLTTLVLSCARLAPPATEHPVEPVVASCALTDTLSLDPAVITGVLPNGLTYFIRRNGKPEGRAELRLAVNVGSVLEDEDQRGLAHFTEHMAFNGTEHFAKHELTDFLESIGMRFGPELNAYTSFDETVYMLHVPTDSAELVEKAFLILHDWACGMLLEDEEIDKERGVIMEEWRGRRGADARISDRQYPVLYHGSRYGVRLPIGEPSVIEGCEYETLRRFYRDWYRPDLMAVVAVGDFDPAWIKTLIEERFSGITLPETMREREFFPVPDHDSLLCIVTTDPEATRTQLSLVYKGPRRPIVTGEDYRRRMVENLHLSMLNRRLEERAKETDPDFIRAYSMNRAIARTKEAYTLTAQVRDGGVIRGLEALLGEAQRVYQHGFISTELEREKLVFLRNADRAYVEQDKTESNRLIWSYVGSFLRDEPTPGVEFAYRFCQEHLPGITLDEVNGFAQTWMNGSRVVMVSAPESVENPPPNEEELAARIAAVKHAAYEAYEDAMPGLQLLDRIPAPGSVVAERQLDAVGATEWTLSNGIRVVWKPTDFKNDEILFSAFSPGGSSLVPDSLVTAASSACGIVLESGVGAFSKTQLDKVLAGSLVFMWPSIDEAFEGMNGSFSPKDMETAFQLIHLYFTAVREDSAAFGAYRTQMEEYVRNRSAEPREVYQDTVSATLSQYHPRHRLWTAETVRELDLGEALAVYRDRFADAGDFTFVFVGALDPEALRPLAATYLASLPALGRGETWRDVGPTPPEGVVEKEVRLGIEKKGEVRLVFPSDLAWSPQAVHRIRSMAQAMQIRLRERIREDMSGTYGVGVRPGLVRYPKSKCFAWISFGCDPDRADELVEAVLSEIAAIQAEGPDSVDLAKVKEAQRRQFVKGLQENRFWQNALHDAYLHDEPVEDILSYSDLIESLTAEDIREAAVSVFDFDRYVKIALYPGDTGGGAVGL